jgi:hypothetical protein
MTIEPKIVLNIGLCLALLSSAAAAEDRALVGSGSAAPGTITHIDTFLDQCPADDPALPQILSDFEIRHNGTPTSLPACSAPVSALPVAQYTDELIVLQGLRVMYYMDRGQSGHLPWTSGTLYDWMRSKVDGINIVDGAGSSCCSVIDGKTFMNVGAQNDFNRDFDHSWMGISGNISLYAHEARHADGFPHVSCCGIPGGCDNSFDVQNLSPYGIQWWLNDLWLQGTINVGFACLSSAEVQAIVNWHLGALNSQLRDRFCTDPPATVSTPAEPGGPCFSSTGCVPNDETMCLSQGRFQVRVHWRTQQGTQGQGQSHPLTDDSGYFWFFNPDNVELVVKIIDACGPPFDRFWVFAAGLTNVETTITVTDTLHNESKEYRNTLGQAFQPIQDTQAFATCP